MLQTYPSVVEVFIIEESTTKLTIISYADIKLSVIFDISCNTNTFNEIK